MLVKISRNCKPDENTAFIKVGDRTCLIDAEDHDRIGCYKWHLRRIRSQVYAVRKRQGTNGMFYIHMHRQIMRTPKGKIVHHKNRCGLDNRKHNLENISPEAHRAIHMFW